MSKLSEAIDKAKREGHDGESAIESLAPSPSVTAVESATVVPLSKRQRQSAPAPRTIPAEAPSRTDAHEPPEEHMVSLVNPHSFEAEQFRALRHIVEQCHRDAGLRVLGVTSPSEGDGKSLVAVNLAGALAQNRDARVLLVDCDLRAPAVSNLVGFRGPGRGVSELVHNPTLDLNDVLLERSSYNLTVLQAGSPPESPYEILKSARLASILQEARSAFDFVVIDTPPVIAFPDTRVLDDYVDAFVLVVGAHKTPRKLVEEASRMFPQDKLLGLVFNGETPTKDYRYRSYYGRGRARQGFWRKLTSFGGG